MNVRGIQKEMIGTVISDKMIKTLLVETQRHVEHPRYRKIYVRRSKFAVHDEKGLAKVGDVVKIRECRPLSKTKRFRLVSVVRAHPEEILVAEKPLNKTAQKKTRKRQGAKK